MKEVETTIVGSVVTKTALNSVGVKRLAHEQDVYRQLTGSPHITSVIDYGDSLKLQEVDGINAKQWLDLKEDWTCVPQDYSSAMTKLEQYVTAEMDFIERGVMYRDLNLEHLFFSKDKVVLIDLEEAVLQDERNSWHFDSRRGTWETMALEEFKARGKLTERTATYRVAVVAHLALAGRLPFPRKALPQRQSTYAWRRGHAALVSNQLDRGQRRVFSAALAREPARRFKDPASFLNALKRTV